MCDPGRPAHKHVAGQVIRRNQESSGRVIGVIEARTVVVGMGVRMVVGVVVWMRGRVSDRVLVHELVIILGVDMRDWQPAQQ